MKQISINIYKFDELSEEAKKRALLDHYDINVFFDWWEFTYECAEDIGIKITGFDLEHGGDISGDPYDDYHVIADKIINNHGEYTETYKMASNYLNYRKNLVAKYSDGIKFDRVDEGNEYDFDKEEDDLNNDFFNDILNCYLSILRNEYEYLTSDEVIIESIEANEYDFTEDGKQYF